MVEIFQGIYRGSRKHAALNLKNISCADICRYTHGLSHDSRVITTRCHILCLLDQFAYGYCGLRLYAHLAVALAGQLICSYIDSCAVLCLYL